MKKNPLYPSRLRNRVEFLRRVVTVEHGISKERWETAFICWCGVEPLSGREFWEAAAINRENEVRFTIRYRKDVSAEMRIRLDGTVYDITSIVGLQHQLLTFSAGGQSIVQINDADLLDAHFHVSLNVLKIAAVGFPAGKVGGFTDRDVVHPIIGRKERLCYGRSLICLDVPACDLFRNLLIVGILSGVPALFYPVIPPSGRFELHQNFFCRLFREIQFQTVALLIDNELCVHKATSFV